ncbi:MAG TPA: pyrroline-5-carboxylate reductase [Candidatus Hydrogenedentes bacterium]|nr:pyrroline-5-carboxylate reductase [Candidatus Hydrogenedentota bacterium]
MIHGRLGFLGYGNMGSAILEGLIRTGVLSANHAIVFDPLPERQEAARNLGVDVAPSAAELAAASDILVLSVKPQTMETALQVAGPHVKPSALIISIAAGISIAWLQKRLPEGVHIIRVMPNTPALVQAGAAGVALGPTCTDQDAAVARVLFEAVGIVEIVAEKDIDAVTALSGSGPAYFFYVVECLVRAAKAEGLEESVATRLAVQTLLGAGHLLKTSGTSAAELRQKVTSKGGTTEAALKRFQEEGLERIVQEAVRAAAMRSRELGA